LLRIRLLPPPLLDPLENFFADFVGDPEIFEINYLLSGLLISIGLKMYLDFSHVIVINRSSWLFTPYLKASLLKKAR
jgi:hypothetical protein